MHKVYSSKMYQLMYFIQHCSFCYTLHTCTLIILDRRADFLLQLLAPTRAYIMSCGPPEKVAE